MGCTLSLEFCFLQTCCHDSTAPQSLSSFIEEKALNSYRKAFGTDYGSIQSFKVDPEEHNTNAWVGCTADTATEATFELTLTNNTVHPEIILKKLQRSLKKKIVEFV